MGETYYDVLEVDPDATQDEIESAYRERVLETHPDHSDDPDATEKFQRVMTAKSVLTDGTERARYDRLSHEAYVGLGDGTTTNDPSAASDESARSAAASSRTGTRQASTGRETGAEGKTATSSGTATETGTAGSDTAGGRTTANGRRTSERTGNRDSAQTGSRHARQRSKRRRQRAKQRAANGGPFDADESGSSTTETATASGTATDTGDPEGAGYSVHDWDDEVDLEWEGPTIDQTAVISLGTVALLYPLFVAASLTPMFSLPINAIIVVCTLALIGYLLTMPRIAAVTFGVWSVLFPVGIVRFAPVEFLSLFGLLALAFAWVPFGYAVALWWVLRP
ncbi:J domain-containing protein [Natrinema sp. SYSU A 869]|uniref:J domain-containing protein n=1 Tax=Natrinema sp. SYSU A 869 TaxID=2871694 RepID=UPI001CA41DA3|nr:J domain-containing protein [Natrinema sp. SYSU A 869]